MLILRISIMDYVKQQLKFLTGHIVSLIEESYKKYKLRLDNSAYQVGTRLTNSEITRINEYVNINAPRYKLEQLNCENLKKVSEYYIYSKIEKCDPSSVCNIGCFYCGADYKFLQKHPKCKIYGLDFGDIIELNKELAHENLLLYSGYPLQILEKLHDENIKFDYAIMTRTATLINIEQLLIYMEILSKMAKNIIFLEVGKISTVPLLQLDVNKIEVMKPVRIYKGMYIHNYPKILKMCGYEIIEEKILHYNEFKQYFDRDHDFVYVHGRKSGEDKNSRVDKGR